MIGREIFEIDGVKLPSNASKAKSGIRADCQHQRVKLEAAAQTMLERHRAEDQKAVELDLRLKEDKRSIACKPMPQTCSNGSTIIPKTARAAKALLEILL